MRPQILVPAKNLPSSKEIKKWEQLLRKDYLKNVWILEKNRRKVKTIFEKDI